MKPVHPRPEGPLSFITGACQIRTEVTFLSFLRFMAREMVAATQGIRGHSLGDQLPSSPSALPRQGCGQRHLQAKPTPTLENGLKGWAMTISAQALRVLTVCVVELLGPFYRWTH